MRPPLFSSNIFCDHLTQKFHEKYQKINLIQEIYQIFEKVLHDEIILHKFELKQIPDIGVREKPGKPRHPKFFLFSNILLTIFLLVFIESREKRLFLAIFSDKELES